MENKNSTHQIAVLGRTTAILSERLPAFKLSERPLAGCIRPIQNEIVARPGHPIHEAIITHLRLSPGACLVDLGSGHGGTLLAAFHRYAGVRLVGIDAHRGSLARAQALLPSGSVLVQADVSQPLPLATGSVDALVCHNVLELLAEPGTLLEEAARILRPGGQAVWSHTDFDALVINAPDVELTRRICHGYADCPQDWMAHTDGRMGRKLTSLVRRSPLVLDEVDVHFLVSTTLDGLARDRIEEIIAVLREQAQRNRGLVGLDELDAWLDGLASLDEVGEFFYAEPVFIAVAHRPTAHHR